MGDKIGELRSTSEATQFGIICVSLALWGFLWMQHVVGSWLAILGAAATMFALHVLSLRMGSVLEVFEDGFTISDDGEPFAIAYDDLKSVAAKSTHHNVRGMYAGSRAVLTFERAQGRPWFRYECDYRRGDSNETLIEQLVARCSEAIQVRLLDEMKTQGTVRWTDEVSMSAQGFLLQRPGASAPLVVPFAEIEEVKVADNELRLWKQGDAVVPFYTQRNDTPNFIPLYDLFCNLCRSARQIAGAPATDVDRGTNSLVRLAESTV